MIISSTDLKQFTKKKEKKDLVMLSVQRKWQSTARAVQHLDSLENAMLTGKALRPIYTSALGARSRYGVAYT